MSDNVWDELMRSPLDPDPDESSGWLDALVPIALAIMFGLGLGLVLTNGSADSTTTLAVQPSTTSTTAPLPPEPIVPAGYAEAGDIGLKALATFNRGDDLYLIVNSSTRSDLDRVETNEFHVAEWVLAGDGIEVVASRALDAAIAPGVRLVEFPGVNGLPISVPELRVRQATEMVVRTGCNGCGATSVDNATGEIVLDGFDLPYSIAEPVMIPVGTGISVVLDTLEITDEWGFAEWRVVADDDARLRVNLVVTFEGTDDPATEELDPTLLVPLHYFGPSQQNVVAANPEPFARSGSIRLDRAGEIMTEQNRPEQIVLQWDVEWQHPVGDPITLPLDGVIDLGSVG